MFKGFTDSETFTQIPDTFFHQVFNKIDDLAELKVTLYIFWRIEHMESKFRSICRSEIVEDTAFMAGISAAELDLGLEKSVQRGSLVRVENEEGGFYFLNSPRGRAAAEALKKNDWRASARSSSTIPIERPNIYKLYEENIGALTPLIADALKDAEQTYSEEWVAEAIAEATKQNKRNWKYAEAILRRWKEEGHGKEQNRRNTEALRGRDVQKQVEDFLKRGK
jgi:DNA replication protein